MLRRESEPVADARIPGRGLSRGSRAAARAVAEALFATPAGPPPRDRLEWALAEFDDLVARASGRAATLLRLSLLTLSVAAPLLAGRLPPLARLPVAARVEALRRLERTPLVAALFAVKAMLSICYYEHPDAAREAGYDGLCLTDVEARA